MIEQLDVFDDNYRFQGTAEKGTVHGRSLWHRVFICILINLLY